MRAEVRDYYRLMGETSRLAEGRGRLEFLRTRDILRRALPAAPARILDVGGATGVYAEPLAARLPGVTASVGDARSLDLPDASVDAVLLFGPLYHLIERDERIVAWREAARVVRPGGAIAGAMINRFASMHDGLSGLFAEDPAFVAVVEETLATGIHRPDRPDGRWFTTAYLHHPDEIAAEVAEAGLPLDRLVSVEGPQWSLGDLGEWLADEARTAWLLDWLRRIEAEPALLGASSHVMALAHRP
jgi:SAM-dependent methyltransferase